VCSKVFEILRSYRVNLSFVTQTIPALHEIYGENARRALQGNAGVKLYPQQQNGSKMTLEEMLPNQFSRDLLTGCLRVASD
jgi:hypothetical protein